MFCMYTIYDLATKLLVLLCARDAVQCGAFAEGLQWFAYLLCGVCASSCV